MPGSTVTVFIHREELLAMNLPGGMVHAYTREIGDNAVAYAQVGAPVRSGELASSITNDYLGSNGDGTNFRVHAHADHAYYVHEGTAGSFAPGFRSAMVLYKSHTFVPARYARYDGMRIRKVAGQIANPFLARALARAIRGI